MQHGTRFPLRAMSGRGEALAYVLIAVACWLGGVDALRAQSPAARLSPPTAVLDQEFSAVTSVRELSDGRVLVTDRTERLLAVVDFESGSVSNIGREGQGPGEYRQPGWLYAIGRDSTVFTDAVSRAWHLVVGTSIVETIRGDQPLLELAGPSLPGAAQGVVLALQGYFWDPSVTLRFTDYADSVFVLLARAPFQDPSRLQVDTIGRARGTGRSAMCARARGPDGPAPFPSTCSLIRTQDHAMAFDDSWVAFARAEPYRVDWRTPAGGIRQGPPLPFTARAVQAADRCAAVQGWPHAGPEPCEPSSEGSMAWPETMPPFLDRTPSGTSAPFTPVLFASPDGRLVIRRAPAAETHYDIVERDGTLSETLALPRNEAIVGFGRQSVYVIETDPLGLQQLRRHPWPL